MKQKLVFIASMIIFVCALCFAIPSQPTDNSSFSTVVPSELNIPNPRASNISKPFPTNKWFNSMLYNQYHNFSLNMYLYPQVFRAEQTGFLIEYPKVIYSADKINFKDSDYDDPTTTDMYANTVKVEISTTVLNGYTIGFPSAKLDSCRDFAAKIKWENSNNYWMTSTVVQGSPFSYYEFCEGVYPSVAFPYEWGNFWDGSTPGYTLYNAQTGEKVEEDVLEYSADAVLLHVHLLNKDVYYGIFVPAGTKFVQDSNNLQGGNNYFPWIRTVIKFSGNDKYVSIALLPSKDLSQAKEDVKNYYKYAYNFVTGTNVNWEVKSDYSSQTNFNFSVTKKRTDIEGQQEGTLFCLFPHQYNNLISQTNIITGKSFDTLRGNLKLASGNSFSTKTNFYGIVPFFQYSLNEIKTEMLEYLTEDNNGIKVSEVSGNPYRAGKIIAKLANMLPVADNLNDSTLKNSITIKLRELLKNWFTYSAGEQNKYFAYDDKWGGFLGIKDDEFYSHLYNDHHFHFGYFIYSAAILAMYDENFVREYGQMVNLLIKDIANTKRNDSNFPYMRHFDFYESHSWSNGMGGNDNRGIDQESSSEAMNAWSAIYLWGLATDNEEYKKLGAYLYSNEYEAIKYYYFDIDGDILKSPYNHNSVGILRGGNIEYNVFWNPYNGSREIKGIQLLPITPSMTYFAYNKDYAQNFYLQMENETPNNYHWNDIWTRFKSLFNPLEALNCFIEHPEVDEGGSKSFTYHFINFFNKYGTPNFTYTANMPSYIVLEKDGTINYGAYNPGSSYRNVHFYDSLGEDLGYLRVPARSFSLSSKLIKGGEGDVISVYPVPYKPNSGGRYGGDGIYFLGVTEGANIKIFNIAGEKVFEKNVLGQDNLFIWNAKNNAGNNIASGIYFYYIKTSEGKKIKGKLAIER